jgi:hypothetical protein
MIDILIAVDGAKLANQVADGKLSAGSQSNPTSLGAWQQSDVYIAMITQNSSTVNDGGQSELDVKANSGDSIKWTMQTFDGNADYTAYLYNGVFNPATNITPLVYFNQNTSEYLPTGSDPTVTPTLEHNLCRAGDRYRARHQDPVHVVLRPGRQRQQREYYRPLHLGPFYRRSPLVFRNRFDSVTIPPVTAGPSHPLLVSKQIPGELSDGKCVLSID